VVLGTNAGFIARIFFFGRGEGRLTLSRMR
jgi:hypothetical protein